MQNDGSLSVFFAQKQTQDEARIVVEVRQKHKQLVSSRKGLVDIPLS